MNVDLPILALDLDGTLLRTDQSVSSRCRESIKKAIDAGVAVVIATGRTWWESRDALAAIGLRIPLLKDELDPIHSTRGPTHPDFAATRADGLLWDATSLDGLEKPAN